MIKKGLKCLFGVTERHNLIYRCRENGVTIARILT